MDFSFFLLLFSREDRRLYTDNNILLFFKIIIYSKGIGIGIGIEYVELIRLIHKID